MASHLYQTPKGWRAQVSYTDRRTGQRKQERIGPFRTKREAQAAADARLKEARENPAAADASILVERYLLDRWLPAKRAKGLKETTLDGYEWQVRKYLIPALGHLPLRDLTAAAVVQFATDFASQQTRRGTVRSGESVRATLRVLRSAMSDAQRWGYLPRNPVSDAKPDLPRLGPPPPPKWWSPDQLRRFLVAVASDRLVALWVLLCTTGMRRGEVAGLRWSVVDFAAGTVTIERSRVHTTKGVVDQDSVKAEASERTIHLDRVTLETLRGHRDLQRELFGDQWSSDGPVFLGDKGGQIRPDAITKCFVALAKQAGLPAIRLHDLRHSYVTAAREAGVSIDVIAERVGHGDERTTKRIYQHEVPSLDADAADRIADLIFGSDPADGTRDGEDTDDVAAAEDDGEDHLDVNAIDDPDVEM